MRNGKEFPVFAADQARKSPPHTKAGGRSAPGTTSVPINNSKFIAVTVSFDYPNQMEFHRVTNDDAYIGAIKAWKNRLYKSKRLASY